MMARLLGNKVGKDVCEALGLDADGVFKIEVKMEVGGIWTVEVGRFLLSEEEKKLEKILERYSLVPKEETE